MSDGLGPAAPGTQHVLLDFGLDEAQLARANRLHEDSIVFDLVSQGPGGNIFGAYSAPLQLEFKAKLATLGLGFDGLLEADFWPYEMARTGKSELVREWYRLAGLTCGAYSVPVHDLHDTQWATLQAASAKYSDLPWLRRITTAAEIRQCKRDGTVAFYGYWQPVTPAPRDLKAIDRAYERGLRCFMLTYNRMDNIGVGCTERVDAGLSMFGVEAVEHCNRIGVVVDVSHCGHLTTMDACRHSSKPVIANHTAAHAVFPHARGKRDDALRAIADTGGVIGVVAVPFFLSSKATPTIEDMLGHIDYIANLVGWQHVAIGTDWPLTAPDDVLQATLAGETKSIGFRKQDRVDVTQRLVGFDDCRDLPNITRGLVKRGYRDEQIRGVLGENALRVFAEVSG